MRAKKFFCIVFSLVLLAVSMPIYSNALEYYGDNYVEGEVLFSYEEPISTDSFYEETLEFNDEIKKIGITEYEDIFENCESEEIQTCSVNNYSKSNDDLQIYLAKTDKDVIKTCEKLKKINGVKFAEPNYTMQTDSFSLPTEITNTNSGSLYNKYCKWYFDYMHIPETYLEYGVSGEGVLVAVIDNGFNLSAIDFPNNLWDDGNGHHGWNAYAQNYDLSPVYDNNGAVLNDTSHGSNVAGIIGMKANNGNGVGVAYNADLMLVKVAGYTTGKTTNLTIDAVCRGINYAKNNKADIINLSLGTSNPSSSLAATINSAFSAGCVIVAAAGNSGYDSTSVVHYPASYGNVIGVMAIDKDDPTQLSNFSNYNVPAKEIYDVAAPGVNIIGCKNDSNGLSSMNGTSQATPLVAGCIALYMSKYPNKTVDEVYDAVRNSPKSYVSNNSEKTGSYKYKRFDALSMIEYSEIYPELNENINTSVVIDKENKIIFGLDERFTDITDYITITPNSGTMQFVPTALGNGTGSKLNLYTLNKELYESYDIIIFGDLNGDAVADGQDAVVALCALDVNGVGYDSCVLKASDVDFDKNLSNSDIDIIFKYAIGLDYIFQF